VHIRAARARANRKLVAKRPFLLSSLLLICLFAAGQLPARAESITLSSSQWITPVRIIPFPTSHRPDVRLEYGQPCLIEAGNRLRKLIHNFGRKGFVLVQYQTPYAATEEHCPSGTLFFLPAPEVTTSPP